MADAGAGRLTDGRFVGHRRSADEAEREHEEDERQELVDGFRAGIAEAVVGARPAGTMAADGKRFDAFADLPHYPFPGGRLFQVPFSALGAWYYTLRDKLGV